MDPEKKILDTLFVYGTLMKDAEHLMSSYLLARSTYLGKATMRGKLYKVAFFPGAIYEDSGHTLVHGEAYKLHEPHKVLEVLDDYESYDKTNPDESLFMRQQVSISLEGDRMDCWAYLYNQSPEGYTLIASGDFLKFEINQM